MVFDYDMDGKYSFKYFGTDEWQYVDAYDKVQNNINIESIKICKGDIVKICQMPSSLVSLMLDDCEKLEILCNFENTLEVLFIYNSKITKLEKLSSNLKILTCSYNKIKYIDNFPASLENCTCVCNYLLHLPIKSNLINLHKIYCDNNKITGQFYMPNKLQNMSIDHNNLTSMQNIVLDKLNLLFCCVNKLANINIKKIKISYAERRKLSFRYNYIKFINYSSQQNNIIKVYCDYLGFDSNFNDNYSTDVCIRNSSYYYG